MNLLMDLRILSLLSGLLGLCQVVPWLIAWYLGESTTAFTMSIFTDFAIALLYFLTLHIKHDLHARDGFVVVAFGWMLATVLGGLPFVYDGLMGFIDSWFETASGFTTTGASIVPNVEIWPKSQLFWRAEIQWLGGMGILVLAIAILPFLGGSVMELMKAEVPGPSKDRFVPKIATTAQILWYLYCGFTVANILAFYFSGMDWLEAIDHAFATMATGGYSTRNASLAAFSIAAQWWCTFFMVVAGVNFLLHYRLLIRRDLVVFKDTELRYYLAILTLTSLFMGFVLMVAQNKGLEEAMRHAFFTVASIMTTTGFANDDFVKWPYFLQMMLLCLMVIGGMAGSTAGGIKVVRFTMVWNTFVVVVQRLLQPHRVVVAKIDQNVISREVMENSLIMVILFLFLLFISLIILTAVGMDFPSAFSGALACIANVGPGLAAVGPLENYSAIHDVGKLWLTLMMIAGRLELYTILIIFFPEFWRK